MIGNVRLEDVKLPEGLCEFAPRLRFNMKYDTMQLTHGLFRI